MGSAKKNSTSSGSRPIRANIFSGAAYASNGRGFRHRFLDSPSENRVGIILVVFSILFVLAVLNLQGWLPEGVREFLLPRAWGGELDGLTVEGVGVCSVRGDKYPCGILSKEGEEAVWYAIFSRDQDPELLELVRHDSKTGKQETVWRRVQREPMYPQKVR